jgi:hypothetical protein
MFQLTLKKMVFASIALVVVCAIAVGCGDSRPTRVPVSGTVLIDGVPLSTGSIMFVNGTGRPASGRIDADGHFTLNCYEPGDGAMIGHHRVKVTALESINDRSNRWLAPKKYADEKTSGIEVDVTEPVDDLKIELTWDGGKPFVEHW